MHTVDLPAIHTKRNVHTELLSSLSEIVVLKPSYTSKETDSSALESPQVKYLQQDVCLACY